MALSVRAVAPKSSICAISLRLLNILDSRLESRVSLYYKEPPLPLQNVLPHCRTQVLTSVFIGPIQHPFPNLITALRTRCRWRSRC